jgi:hypothetical protein
MITALCNRVKGVEVLPSDATEAIAAQTALIAALATDPETDSPSFWYGNANQAVVYPCVTFRVSGGSPDRRFADGVSVDDVIIDIDIWENAGVIATLTDIDALLRRVFDDQKDAPQLPLSNGHLAVSLEAFTGLITGHDAERNAWFGLRRYRLIEVD